MLTVRKFRMSMTYCIRKIYSGQNILPIGIVIVGDTKTAINVVIVKIRIETEIEDDGRWTIKVKGRDTCILFE